MKKTRRGCKIRKTIIKIEDINIAFHKEKNIMHSYYNHTYGKSVCQLGTPKSFYPKQHCFSSLSQLDKTRMILSLHNFAFSLRLELSNENFFHKKTILTDKHQPLIIHYCIIGMIILNFLSTARMGLNCVQLQQNMINEKQKNENDFSFQIKRR